MFNRITGQQASTHKQNLPVATGQTGGIQAPTPAAGVLAAVPARVVVVNNVRDPAQSFKQELQQWVEHAPPGSGERRQEAAKRIFEVYEKVGTELDLKYFNLTSLPNLAPLGQLQTLDLNSNNLGALAKNPEAAKAFADGLAQLAQLKTLRLGYNKLGQLAEKPDAANAFFGVLGKLSQLKSLTLYENRLGALSDNPQTANALFNSVSRLNQLERLDLRINDVGTYVEEVWVGAANISNRVKHLRRSHSPDLDSMGSGVNFSNASIDKADDHEVFSSNQNQLVNSTKNPLTEPAHLLAQLRQHNIETEHGAIIELGEPWSTAIESELFEKCATVTDAISAYGMLGHAYDKGKITWPDVQDNLETLCLKVAEKLIDTDINGSDSLAKVRNQELAYLLSVVQHGADVGALTKRAALQIKQHIKTNVRINHAYSAIQALQKNQEVLLGGLQSVGSVLVQHMAHTAQLQTEFVKYFQQLAENQQQLLENQRKLANAHGQLRKDLDVEIKRLKGDQEEIANNLHQVGLKMLNAKRIRAVGGALATGVSLLPWMGPAIVEGSKAIANALGVANARGFAVGLGNLKESLSRISGESVFQNTREDLKELTLGETLQSYGIKLPDDAITTRFAGITLGQLSDGIQSGANYVADRIDSLQSDSQASPEALAPLAGLTIALPTVLGQQLQQSTTQPHLPVLAQPANSSTSANLSAEHARRLNAINVPQPTANQAGAQQSAGALRRIESIGSLATVDEAEDELAAAIKFFDGSKPYKVKEFNRLVQGAIKAEQVQPGSTILTKKTVPTRNSSSAGATAMDLAVHYGRLEALLAMKEAVLVTSNGPNLVELESAKRKVYHRAVSESERRQSMYNDLGKRIAPRDDQAS